MNMLENVSCVAFIFYGTIFNINVVPLSISVQRNGVPLSKIAHNGTPFRYTLPLFTTIP